MEKPAFNLEKYMEIKAAIINAADQLEWEGKPHGMTISNKLNKLADQLDSIWFEHQTLTS